MSTPSSSAPSSPNAEKANGSPPEHRLRSSAPQKVSRHHGPSGRDVLLFLIASRLLNALVLQTFFQPDEYFQALEPAWELAFGSGAGAWITWEWKQHLRSAIHPAIFALCYKAADALAACLNISNSLRAEVLLVAPKTVQALIAAVGDYYTWKLAEATYGTSSLASAAALILTVASPWQWFCATRTFSNCLEATLTVVALYNWPWHWSVANDDKGHFQVDGCGLRVRDADSPSKGAVDEITRLRRALLFAAVATILRPTNILVWASLTFLTILRRDKSQKFVKIPLTEQTVLIDAASWALLPSKPELGAFVQEAVVCGSSVLALSAITDRLFYKTWTFPPLNFLYFNVVQSLAIFYGNNNWHYYLSQGYPLLLITALPFTLASMYRAITKTKGFTKLSPVSQNILSSLTAVSIFVPAVLSIIAHKEVRFICPLLPGLHILAAHPVSTFFAPAFEHAIPSSRTTQLFKRLLLGLLLFLNALIALYTATTHNSGLINITHYLRHEFETYYDHDISTSNSNTHSNMTVGFLMPCHSTPWRSHLQYPPKSTKPGIDAWALTCEPPLNLSREEKAMYLDEADQFYGDPSVWLKRRMSRRPPAVQHQNGNNHNRRNRNHEPGVFAPAHRPRRMFEIETGIEENLWRERKGRRPWPDYLVFMEQLEPQMRRAGLLGNGYTECKRIFNSHAHEDWRRVGDVVVWCLFEERAERARTAEAGKEGKEVGLEKQVEIERDVEEVKKRVVERPFWRQAPLGLLDGDRERKRDVSREGWSEWIKGLLGIGSVRKKRRWWEVGDWT